MQPRDTKRAISDAALRLFAMGSFPQVTVKGICGTAGVARSTFYENFDDKVAVLRHILSEEYVWPYGMGEYEGRGPVAPLLASPCKFQLIQLALGPSVMRDYFGQLMKGSSPAFFAEYQEHHGTLVTSLRRAEQAGAIASHCPPSELACLSIFVLSQLSMTWVYADGEFDMLGESFVHLCGLYGLSAQTHRALWDTIVQEISDELDRFLQIG